MSTPDGAIRGFASAALHAPYILRIDASQNALSSNNRKNKRKTSNNPLFPFFPVTNTLQPIFVKCLYVVWYTRVYWQMAAAGS
jgi:hypothetical protein